MGCMYKVVEVHSSAAIEWEANRISSQGWRLMSVMPVPGAGPHINSKFVLVFEQETPDRPRIQDVINFVQWTRDRRVLPN